MTTEVAGSPVDGQRVLSVQKFEVDPPSNLSQELVDPENTFATTKEEEWITKKKTELTTTRQIETRVKRQVVLEDGKVVEDSGPIVTTNTTEDTEKQEHKQTEHRTLGGDDAPGPDWVAVPSPAGGLVKEVKERKVTSREEREERVETEDVQHLGDITDEAYLEAIKNQQDLREALRSPVPGETGGGELVASSRIVSQSSKGRKVIDTEDSVEVSQVQEDGRLVTEKRRTTEHEEIREDEEPDDDPTGVEENKETHRESSHRFAKSRDQDLVEYVADGVKIGEEMRYMAENVEAERHGDDPMDHQDWESLSTRIRRMRRQSKGHRAAPGQTGLGAIGGGPLAMDRKDALTKKPLDFDQEEETRKVETSKWLEHHFGSDSRSSKDSIDDDELVPSAANGPSTSFINVTMKSRPIGSRKTAANNGHGSSNSAASPSSYIANVSSSSRVFVSSSPEEPDADDRRRHATNGVSSPSGGYFHGVSEWSERRINESGRNSANLAVPPQRPDRVQVLPTGANHTFSKPRLGGSTNHLDRVASPSPVVNGRSSSPFQSNHNSSSHRNNSYESTSNFLAAERNGGACSPVPRFVNRDSPSNLHRVSSPHQRSSSPYHHKGSRTVQQQTVAYNGNHHEEEELHNGYRRGHSPQPPQRRRHSEREELDERYIKNRTRYHRSREGNDEDEEPEEEVEPPPDYSPPPAQPSPSPSPSPENAGRDTPSQTTVTPVPSSLSGNKKLYQRTRFAADIPPPPSRHPPPSRSKSPGHSTTSKIGESLRKFVGKFRSSSTERKNKQHRRKRSPSPRQPSSSTYQQYHVIDNNIPSVAWSKGGEETRPNEAGHSAEGGESPRQPLAPPRSSRGDDRKECGTQTAREMSRGAVQRFYLGEDPFGGSIYGREREYDGVTPRRRHHHRQNGHHSSGHRRGSHEEDDINRANINSSSTLGRLSKSTSRLVNSSGSDMGRATQTLPRKLHRAPAPPAASNSMINVSIVNHVTGPAKPARTYRSSLSRSKSFNVHGGSDTETSSSLLLGARDRNRDAFKSNPHLHRLDESPPPLKSPGILASISRSQRDLSRTTSASPDRDDYDYERSRRQESSHRFSKSTSNLLGNGYNSSQETKKKIFMKGLMDRAPELYKTLHGDEEIPKSPSPSPGSRLFTTSTPLKNGSRVLDYSSSFRSSSTNATPPPSSPYRSNLTVNGVGELGRTTSPKPSYTSTLTHTPYRDTKKTSMTRRGSDDYSETVRITSKSDDPIHPSITNTVQSFSKKTVPTKSGRSTETIESSETTTVTKSRFRGGNADKYLENGNYSMRNGHAGGVVIEVRPSRK